MTCRCPSSPGGGAVARRTAGAFPREATAHAKLRCVRVHSGRDTHLSPWLGCCLSLCPGLQALSLQRRCQARVLGLQGCHGNVFEVSATAWAEGTGSGCCCSPA